MKIVLEVKNEPKKDDVLLYDGKEWVSLSKNVILEEVFILKQQLKETNTKLEQSLEKINEKLKDYHNFLQTLTKEK